jgi:hypothetical protein
MTIHLVGRVRFQLITHNVRVDGEEAIAISAQKLTELKKQLAVERAENGRLKSEIRMLDELIGKTREPQTTLIHTIRDKQLRIQQLADDLETAEQQLR